MGAKRVLVLGMTNRMGGVETFIRNVVLNSDKERVEFDFLVHDESGMCQYEDELRRFYATSNHEHFHFVPPIKRNPLKCLNALTSIKNGPSGSGYDWVHLNTGFAPEIVYCLPLLRGKRTRLIVHSHNGSGSGKTLQLMFRLLVNRLADVRLACSYIAAEWMFGRRYRKTTAIITNGIEVLRYAYANGKRRAARSALGAGDAFLVGHVGRFHEQKNHVFVVSIFKELLEIRPDSLLCLVGVGELQEDIQKQVRDAGISDRVLFLGARSDLDELYSAFDVLLMPSLYEGLPVTVVEAQASGLPVVVADTVTDEASITELVHRMSLSSSADEWAARILSVQIGSREHYAEQLIAGGYDICSTVEALEEIYEGRPVDSING